MVAIVKLQLQRRVLVAGTTIVATSERSTCMGLVEIPMMDVSLRVSKTSQVIETNLCDRNFIFTNKVTNKMVFLWYFF